ncbi:MULTISPECIES: hypothetical protein [unclassified Sulfurovum]|uniref:hypothetical protein n=1 Tax=unclassified Sulfurovum TaxID=2646778 RepID=UPI001CC64B78|nr:MULTISPECIES: hypothetical protein [unclassified Sulfurovum]
MEKHLMRCLKNFQDWMLELWFRVFPWKANSGIANILHNNRLLLGRMIYFDDVQTI